MPRGLPNLEWIHVFAVAAEVESFVLAGQRLGVTAGAVSQRVKSLERHLDVQLFDRHAQGLRLTDAGRRYAAAVGQPLDQLAEATRDLAVADPAAPIRMTVLPAFAQLWLGPRLADFHAQHENKHVEIWADPSIVDLRSSDFDLAIRYGQPPFPGCDHRQILSDALVPVASPELLDTAQRDAAGLPIGVPINVDSYWGNDLATWLAGTDTSVDAEPRHQTFSLYAMALEATLRGRGFMIGHAALVQDLVDEGRLVYLSDRQVPTVHQFHVLTKAGAPLSRSVAAFVDWIVGPRS